MNNIIYFIICCAVLLGCKSEKSFEIILNPENATDKQVFLSDLVDELIYIPLDNKVIFPGIGWINMCGNHIVIGARGEPLLHFDTEGNFLNSIGSRGRGPGEYIFAHYFTMDSNCNKIYIYDNNKIIIYRTDGKFIKQFHRPEFEGHLGQIYYRDGRIYLGYQLMYGRAKYNWVIIDTLGNLQSLKLNKIPTFKTRYPGGAGFFTIKDDLYYWNDYCDTIFLLQEDSYNPAMYFAQGGFRKPYGPVSDEVGYFWPYRFYNTKDYLIFGYNYNKQSHIALVDKKDGNIFTVNKGTPGIRGYEAGIKNDIDGGLDFVPYNSFLKDGDKYLVNWYNAYRLKGYVESEAFRNSTPKFPEKKKELEKLAARLDENDNQVLVLAKLKQ